MYSRNVRRKTKASGLYPTLSLGKLRMPMSYFPAPDRQRAAECLTLDQESTNGLPAIIYLHQQDGLVRVTYLESSLIRQTLTLKGPITSLFRHCVVAHHRGHGDTGHDWSEPNYFPAILGIIFLLQNIIIYHSRVLWAVKQSTQRTFTVKTEIDLVWWRQTNSLC